MIVLRSYEEHVIKSGNHVAEYILLHQSEEFEVIENNIKSGALVICRIDETQDNMNFYYIVSGSIKNSDTDRVYRTGSTLHLKELETALVFEVLEDTKLIWTTQKPLYERMHLENNAILQVLDQIQQKDAYTKEHTLRVTSYARQLAKLCGLNGRDIYDVIMGSLCHDLGKIEIEDAILNKQGKLTDQEYDVIKQHVEYGYQRAKQYLTDGQAEIVYAHHERLDGCGYPRGLSGDRIPEGAKLLAVVDSYDAMTSDRPYRKGMSIEDALLELKKGIGSLFKKEYVEAFCHWIESEEFKTTQVI